MDVPASPLRHPHVKTGNDERHPYSEGVSPPQGKLGEPTSVSWEPIFRSQYRHPPLLGKLEQTVRAPTF